MNNLDFAGFIGVDSGDNGLNGPCEWFSSVQKGTGSTGGQSTLLSSFAFAYCSLALDVKSGGPGATLTLNFWDGFSNGIGSIPGKQGTNVGSVTITGLPGNTGYTGWLAGFAPCRSTLVTVGIFGGAPIILPDANIAVSFRFEQTDTGGVLGSSAVFLSCIASCSAGPTGSLDNMGMIDRIDTYCAGSFLTSFSFVTGGPFTTSFTSISFQLNEVVPLDASDSVVVDNGGALMCNSSSLSGVSAPFIGGGPWVQSVNCGGIPGTLTVIFGGFVPIDPLVCANTFIGDFLVSPTAGRLALLTTALSRSGGLATGAIAPSVPLDLSFLGTAIHTQAYCAGFPVPAGQTRLTNRVSTCIGTLE